MTCLLDLLGHVKGKGDTSARSFKQLNWEISWWPIQSPRRRVNTNSIYFPASPFSCVGVDTRDFPHGAIVPRQRRHVRQELQTAEAETHGGPSLPLDESHARQVHEEDWQWLQVHEGDHDRVGRRMDVGVLELPGYSRWAFACYRSHPLIILLIYSLIASAAMERARAVCCSYAGTLQFIWFAVFCSQRFGGEQECKLNCLFLYRWCASGALYLPCATVPVSACVSRPVFLF